MTQQPQSYTGNDYVFGYELPTEEMKQLHTQWCYENSKNPGQPMKEDEWHAFLDRWSRESGGTYEIKTNIDGNSAYITMPLTDQEIQAGISHVQKFSLEPHYIDLTDWNQVEQELPVEWTQLYSEKDIEQNQENDSHRESKREKTSSKLFSIGPQWEWETASSNAPSYNAYEEILRDAARDQAIYNQWCSERGRDAGKPFFTDKEWSDYATYWCQAVGRNPEENQDYINKNPSPEELIKAQTYDQKIYQEYVQWCQENGIDDVAQEGFLIHLQEETTSRGNYQLWRETAGKLTSAELFLDWQQGTGSDDYRSFLQETFRNHTQEEALLDQPLSQLINKDTLNASPIVEEKWDAPLDKIIAEFTEQDSILKDPLPMIEEIGQTFDLVDDMEWDIS